MTGVQTCALPISDTRNIPALGRVGDPDDILGSVRVEDGQVSLMICTRPSQRCLVERVTYISGNSIYI